MATIKAGTYRFNDVLSAPSTDLEQSISFTTTPAFTFDEGTMSMVSLDGVMNWATIVVANDFAGFPVIVNFCDTYDNPSTVYARDNGDWSFLADFCAENGFSNTEFLNGCCQTITIPTDQEVSTEFAEWFTANAVADGVQISGKWKFKDVLTIPMADFDFDEQIDFSVAVDYMGQNVSAFCDRIEIAAVGSDEDWRLIYNCITPPFDYEVYVYWNMGRSWEDMFGEGIKTINFGTEPQTVSAEFYNWLTANASKPMASITHNGEEIASLFPGQTATLKCAGMQMPGDVVVTLSDNIGGGSSVDAAAVVGRWKINNFTSSDPWKEDAQFSASVGGVTQDFTGIQYECDNASGQGYYLSGSGKVEVFNTNFDGFTDEAAKTVDFGIEPQFVSARFKSWLEVDATRLEGGAVKEPILEPLTVTENGTYERGYSTVTEEWDANTEYDFTVTVDGIPLNVKKAEKLFFVDDLDAVDDVFRIVEKNAAGEIVNERGYCIMYPVYADEAETDLVGYMDYLSLYSVLWVKNGAFFNAMLGTDRLEDNTVYLTNYASLASGEFRSISLTAPGRLVDGYIPVTVDVQPYWQNLTVTENGTYTATYADYIRSVTVKYSQKELQALVNKTITEVPVKVFGVGDHAFRACNKLEKVALGGTDIGNYAFEDCTSLKSITTEIDPDGTLPNVIDISGYINLYAFRRCTNLPGRLHIRANIISDGAFYGCSALTDLNIHLPTGTGQRKISPTAFGRCTALKTARIRIEKNGTIIYTDAFTGCSSLETIIFDAAETYCAPATYESTILFPDSLQKIYVHADMLDAWKTATGWSMYADKFCAAPVNFTLRGSCYIAPEIMTWSEFLDKYCPFEDVRIVDDKIVYNTGGVIARETDNGYEDVAPTDVIVNGAEYVQLIRN